VVYQEPGGAPHPYMDFALTGTQFGPARKETMRPISVSRAVASAVAAFLGAVTLLLAGPALAQAATLTIEIRSGVGAVDSNQNGVRCRRDAGDPLPKTCAITVGDNDDITLQAVPAADHRFFRWSADNPDCERESTCQVAIAGSDRTVSAGFAPVRTLNILPVGEGSVTVSRPAVDLENGYEAQSVCTRSMEDTSADVPNTGGCRFTYLPGTTVTLVAVPGFLDGGTPTRFASWSPFQCPGVDACTVTISDEDVTVAAVFDPLQLALRVAGTGTVTVAPGGFTCTATPADDPFRECFNTYAPGTTVTLTAATPGVRWVVGCQDVSQDGQTCTTTVDRNPWWVGVAFGGATLDPSDFPPKIRVRFRVIVTGSGNGSVHGDRIDCGNRCSNTYDYGDRERLRADAAAGSRFDHWVGGCGKDPTCTLPVGRITTVRAVFAQTEKQSSGDHGRKGTPKRLSARRVRVAALGRRGKRRVVLVVAVNESATGRLRLLRGRRQVAARTYRLRSGRNRLVLRVPPAARAGRYRLVLSVRAASGTRTVSGNVRLRR
jgi:List-Bact-rpt repeat protein